MKRRLIKIASVVSLILLAGSIWMWFRSYWFDDQLQRTVVGTISTPQGKFNCDRVLWIASSDGKLCILSGQAIGPLTRSDDVAVARHIEAGPFVSISSAIT